MGLFNDADLRPPTAEGWSELSTESLSALLVLDEIPYFGPQKFREIYEQGLRPDELIDDRNRLLAIGGKRGAAFTAALDSAVARRSQLKARADAWLAQATKLEARILSYGDSAYPPVLFRSNYPVPVLFARGAVDVLRSTQTVACVGSRQIRKPYSQLQAAFAEEAAKTGTAVVSGFALGADTIAHDAAVEAGGDTIAVMAGGVDRPFPPENRLLWQTLLLDHHAVFVSEAGFGARASSLTLRRRNKLIVAHSRGVLVGQSAVNGGAMNAYRFALEDHKPVSTFASDGASDTSGNETIAHDPKSGGRVFSIDASGEDYRHWLRELGSSI